MYISGTLGIAVTGMNQRNEHSPGIARCAGLSHAR